jgi:hypothetical protein
MDIPQPAFEALLRKIEAKKSSDGIDLSTEEDLSVAVMNLVSLEEHCFFTGVKTAKSQYFDFLNEVRTIRKDLLGRMIDRHEGETWCIAKHLLATTMRLIEVGSKLQSDGRKKEVREIFGHARKSYALFWALRLKLIDGSGFRKVAAEGKPWTLQDIVDKLVDCCDE